jgi:hypothetical protein
MYVFGSPTAGPATISGFGPNRLVINGDASVQNARITFPFYSSGSGRPKKVARWLLARLTEAVWNFDVSVSSGNHYYLEVTGLKDSELFSSLRKSAVFQTVTEYLDHIAIDAAMSPTDLPLHLTGTISDSTFRVVGRAVSERGKVEYLDQVFTIEKVVSDFDETSVFPILEGRAVTMGDSSGQRVPVYLTMYQIDRATGARQKRGRLQDITFVLESETSSAPEDVLALLGLSPTKVEGKAGEFVARTVARTLGRRVLDPIERQLEKWTFLDEVTLSPGGGRLPSTARLQIERAQSDSLQPTIVRFLTGSQFTVGKHFSRDLFFTYTGELAANPNETTKTRLGLIHMWNLEYRMQPFSPDLVLDLAVQYDAVERKRDESVSLKYSFALEP